MERVDSLVQIFDCLRKSTIVSISSRDELLRLRAAQYSQLAASSYANHSPAKALEYLNKAINVWPSAELYSKRAVIHLNEDNYILAAADACSSILLDSKFPSGYLCRAIALIRLHEYELALKDLCQLRNCLPNSKTYNALYIACRDVYRITGEIAPFHHPEDITENAVNEQYSGFDEDGLTSDPSSSAGFKSSKFTEDYVRGVIESYKTGHFHLTQKRVFAILKCVLDLLKEHSNVPNINVRRKRYLTVVGDLRGNFDNLLSIFKHNRTPRTCRPYLFNGNMIGSGTMNLPCIVTIMCLKILFPEHVFITRGSQESLEMTCINGFEHEVSTVYNDKIFQGFTEVFNWLPVAHVLNNSVLIVHGGLFKDDRITLPDLENIKRNYQPPDDGPLSDILHSDPSNVNGISTKERSRGVWFGPRDTARFCNRNDIDYMIRSHCAPKLCGYEIQTGGKCITVVSSTPSATYLIVSGDTSKYTVMHARRKRLYPKTCTCVTSCKCHRRKPETNSSIEDEYIGGEEGSFVFFEDMLSIQSQEGEARNSLAEEPVLSSLVSLERTNTEVVEEHTGEEDTLKTETTNSLVFETEGSSPFIEFEGEFGF